MVDANIKKLRILKASLPPTDHDSLAYVLRYRVISDDRNRTSHWSPIYNISASGVISVTGALSVTTNIITAIWPNTNNSPSYNVFVSFNGGSFSFSGNTISNSYSFLKTAGATNVRVKVQVASSKKEIKAALNIFDSGTVSLV